MRFLSPGPEATIEVARALSQALGGKGLVVALIGPLGAGKTVFVRGLAVGAGVDPTLVASPTFSIANEYPSALGIEMTHIDLYRLESERELEDAGWLDWLEPDALVAVEWADRLPSALPQDRLEVRLSRPSGSGQDVRCVEVSAGGEGAERALEDWRRALGRCSFVDWE